MMKLAIR